MKIQRTRHKPNDRLLVPIQPPVHRNHAPPLPRLRFGCTNSRSECHFLCCSKMQSAAAFKCACPFQNAGGAAHSITSRRFIARFDDSQFIVRENHSNTNKPFRSQPISDHGVGTVRPWAAVNLNLAHGRHNVSARDGGLPASRRTGAGAFLCAPLRPLPLNAPPTTMPVHSFNYPYHRPADAVVFVAGDLPLIHGPAAAAGPASFQHLKFTKRTHLEIGKNLHSNDLRKICFVALQKANPFLLESQLFLFKAIQRVSKRFKAFQRTWRKKLFLSAANAFWRFTARLGVQPSPTRSRLVQPNPAFSRKKLFFIHSERSWVPH